MVLPALHIWWPAAPTGLLGSRDFVYRCTVSVRRAVLEFIKMEWQETFCDLAEVCQSILSS